LSEEKNMRSAYGSREDGVWKPAKGRKMWEGGRDGKEEGKGGRAGIKY